MIFDCFPFYNEFDILEIRILELYNIVDKFVIVEADKTFRGNPKPFYFLENRDRFRPFNDKIIYLQHKFDKNEDQQKNSLKHALVECKDDDIIMFGDVDEIPNSNYVIEAIDKIKNIKKIRAITFDGNMYCYFLNGMRCLKSGNPVTWMGTIMMRYNYLKKKDLVHIRNGVRNKYNRKYIHLKNSGWHFSFIGSIEKIQEKISNWGHWAEFQHRNNKVYLSKCINQGLYLVETTGNIVQYVPIDDSFPKAVKTNPQAYAHIIKDVSLKRTI